MATKRCSLCKVPLTFRLGRYCDYCRPHRGNDFTQNVLRLQGTLEYIADQRAQGATWRSIGETLGHPHPERFAAYVLNTSDWHEFGRAKK